MPNRTGRGRGRGSLPAKAARRGPGQARRLWIAVLAVGVVVLAVGAVFALRSWRVRWMLKAPLEKARVFHATGEYDKAVRFYEIALTREPSNAEILRGLARCHLAKKRLAKAAEKAELAAELAPSAAAYLLLARIDYVGAGADALLQSRLAGEGRALRDDERSRLVSVVSRARKAQAMDPNAAQAYALMAVAELLLDRAEEALRHARQATEVDPSSRGSRLLVARLLAAAGRTHDALEQCRYAANELGMADAGLLKLTAGLCQRLGLHAEAIGVLDRLLEQRPGDLALRLELAETCFAQGDYARAVQEAGRVTGHYERSDLVSVGAHRVRGMALIQLGQYEEAILDLSRVVAYARDDALAQHWLGVAYLRTGQRAMARDALLDAARLEPRHMPTREVLADMLAAEGRLEGAVAQYRAGIRALDGDPRARRLLVDFALAHGLDDVAREELEAVLQALPRSPDAAHSLGQFHLESGDSHLALQLANYVLALEPESAAGLHLAAQALAALGEPEAAAARFAEAAHQAPRRAAIYLDWAAAQQRAGQLDAAEEVLARAMRALPGHAELRCAYARLCLSSHREEKVAEGLDELRAELRRQPGNLAARVILVDHYLAAGATDRALAAAEAGAQALPGNVPALALLARVRRHREEWARFVAILDDVAKRQPDEFVAYQRVPASIRREHYETAVSLAEQALERYAQHRRRIELDLAVAHLLAGRGPDAAETARKVLARDTLDADAGYVVSLIELADRGHAPQVPACHQDALEPMAVEGWADLVDLHREKPGDARRAARLLLEAFVYQNAGWYDEAIQACQRILEFAPGAELPAVLIPVMWERSGSRARARAACETLLEREAGSPYLRMLFADLLLASREAQEAKAQYQRAVRELPAWLARRSLMPPAEPRAKLALLHQAMGQDEQALRLWRQLYQEYLDRTVPGNNLAWTLMQQWGESVPRTEASEAKSAIEAALAASADHPAVLDTAAWYYHHVGDDAQALRQLTRAAELAPFRAMTHFHLGMVHLRGGRDHEAARALRRAIHLAPGAPFVGEARRALARLRF